MPQRMAVCSIIPSTYLATTILFTRVGGRRVLGSSGVLAAFATIAVTAPVGSWGRRARPMSEQNKAIVRRFEDVFNDKRVDLADEFVASDYIDHGALPG